MDKSASGVNGTCPVCLDRRLKPHSTRVWKVASVEYKLMACSHCGCVHTDPLPSDEVLAGIYGSSFDYRWYQDHYDAKLDDCRARIREYRPYLGKRVLDFGGGVGYFSTAASQEGFESVTYDPFLGSEPPAEKHWDSVVALHVLEHSNDLDRTLTAIKRLLVPGGRLILAVPNLEGAGYGSQGMGWVWAQPPLVHIFHFTRRGLTDLLARHGFGDLEVSYHDRWDANRYCDIEHVDRFRELDAAWGRRPLKAIPAYRRWIARRNSRLRFEGLAKARNLPAVEDVKLAELQVIAVLNPR